MIKILVALLIAFFGAVGSYVAYEASGTNKSNSGSATGAHGAPGPLAGAGLPVVAVGYGVYWLIRRRRGANSAKRDQAPRA
jgi:hypothetical protein